MMTNTRIIALNNEWYYKLHKNHKKLSLSDVLDKKIKQFTKTNIPGSILNDLLKNKIIADPFYSDNEKMVDWVSECDWVYKKVFDAADLSFDTLVFDGIDTVSEVWFNGKLLGVTDNMFRQYTFGISEIIKPKKNELKVILLSPISYAKAEELKYGKLPVALNSTRAYIRKAQYSFGWDWGPSLPNAGIWKTVYLKKSEEVIISEFAFKTLRIREDYVTIEVQFKLPKTIAAGSHYLIEMKRSGFKQALDGKCISGNNKVKFEVVNPKLWWPNGMGEQNLYNVELIVLNENKEEIAAVAKKIGIRTVKLSLKENGEKTFKFIINGKPLFIKGANWIPIDSFLDRGTEKGYEELIALAANANMNMLRVWGGGIYESDVFYDLCDKYGLLVWQDFMFACGSYPEHRDFLSSVEKEVRQNVERIRNHPSIALWCGNNENEWIWTQEQTSSYIEMPGYNIYHKLIPGILKEKKIGEPYWPSSPFGSDKDPNSQTSGNRHQWYIWSFWKDYTTVIEDSSLFVSEFGFQGAANRDTLDAVIPKNERNIQSEIAEHHNKQVEGPERVIRFLSAHLPLRTEWEDYIYLTQLNQGLALKTCLEHWRTNEKTNGSIIWQLNDVWTVISWSLVDSSAAPKMSYYFVKDSFNNIFSKVSITDKEIIINIINDSEKQFRGNLNLESTKLPGGDTEVLKRINISLLGSKTIRLPLGKIDINNSLITSSIYSKENSIIHRNYFVEKEWKHITLPKAKVDIKHNKEENAITIKAKTPIIFGDLYSKGVVFAKRGFILLKNESVIIEYKATNREELDISKLKLFTLNDYLSS
ncbi:MAG: glycoside hydrolase family 2 protein [Bacteroidetes bacterium]|nr:glycoside hydrolase family 2 protein [Bacteroidota bacterium]